MNKILIRLIVGLGNPGIKYEKTRHNAGIWFIKRLLQKDVIKLKPNKKFHGIIVQTRLFNYDIDVLIPTTYMNNCGLAVSTYAKFYKIPSQSILIVHDELDLPVGTVRLKQGGGFAGHNGLRSIIAHLGDDNFNRIRIGINHPTTQEDIVDYVLNQPTKDEQKLIEESIDRAIQVFPLIIQGDFDKAMNQLHK